jgi:hypothetical protein
MRSKAIVQCAACGESKWRFAEAAYVRSSSSGQPSMLSWGNSGRQSGLTATRYEPRCRHVPYARYGSVMVNELVAETKTLQIST